MDSKTTLLIRIIFLVLFTLNVNIDLFAQDEDINVRGNMIDIPIGDTTPQITDYTDFGSSSIGIGIANSFEIQNTFNGGGGGPNTKLTISSISISGTNAGDFVVTTGFTGDINKASSQFFTITFTPSALGLRTATVTIVSDDGDENPWTFNIQGTGTAAMPEIDIEGNGTSITDGDSTPAVGDDTDFGDADLTSGSVVHTFTIQNEGAATLTLTGTGPTYVSISGTHAADFTVTANPSNSIAASGSTTFDITFNPSALGIRAATISIANDDSDEDPYTFDIQGNGTWSGGLHDINVRGGSPLTDIPIGDTTPSTAEGTDFGNSEAGVGVVNTFEIENTYASGPASSNQLTISSIVVSGTHASDFVVTSSITTISRNSSDTFTVTFTPSALGLRTATVTITSDDPDETPWTFDIQGNGTAPNPEINITGLGVSIMDGDNTPITTDDTDWGTVGTGSTTTHTFTIENTAHSLSALTLSNAGSGITITGGSGYFSINTEPAQNATITGGNSTTFSIDFNPLVNGSYTATISIDNDDSDENPYTFDITGTSFTPAPEISIQGGTVLTEIVDGDTTPDNLDGTNYGSINIGNTLERIFTIDNTAGTLDLTISSITLSNTTDFSITTTHGSPVSSGGTTTFGITYSPTVNGTQNCTVTVNNNDSDEGVYDFVIEGNGVQLFYDSDNDGIFDNIDIDDDNDGVIDSEEELDCETSPISYAVNYKFLEETFGSGDRTTINTTYAAISTYCYEDGTNGTNTAECPSLANDDLSDGEYVVYHSIADGDGTDDTPVNEVAAWADNYWYTGGDHTGDTDGRMAMFNASYDPGIFYTAHISGSLANVPITYSFWVLNLDTTLAPDIANRLRPNIKVEFQDMSGNVLTNQDDMQPAVITTGDVPPSINGDHANSWHEFTASLTLAVTEFQVIFTNNETGGLGNDLAIDDIEIKQTLCDFDNDGIADIFDLDNDNDGIPDIVEVGLGNLSNGTGKLDVAWVDANGDGLHDSAAGNVVPDTDGDGTPDYMDLDSDNDGIFDVDESLAGNPGDPNFVNGDGDITGDGVGDGPESEAFREKDVNGNGVPEYYGDGILDIYDFHSAANNYTDAYGNDSQGTVSGTVYYVKDTDGDGIPDYLDITSDGTNFDIDNTLYADLDADNDGVIDDTTDTDGDGLVDSFDTNDNLFGSPRDLERKLHLYFDGRNDYADDSSVINSWGEGSIMTWIKIDPTGTGNQIITGQDSFYLQLNSDKSITANAGGNIASSAVLTTDRWVHIAATYSDSNGALKLYINGAEVDTTSVSGALPSDSSSFSIGRQPDTSSNYFKGYIDELRVFDKALSANELQKMVYQEIEDNAGTARGAIVPLNVSDFVSAGNDTPLPWTNLQRYFRMDNYKDDIIDDLTTPAIDNGLGAKIYNTKIIDVQSAPLPFVTQQSGSLETAVDLSSEGVNGVDAVMYDWSIVKISHDGVYYNGNQKHVGLIVDAVDGSSNPIEFSIQNDSELNVSWYLKLDGDIDLEGESQLIQGLESILDVTSAGNVERDQQGTADTYTYNYWSSPVGISNTTTNNNSYSMTDVFKDGTNPASPVSINWITSGYDGSNANPIGLADYWIWKFANQPNGDYSSWQHVRSTGSILAGEGFTMKGPGTGSIITDQNYVFKGKPNNGDINLTIGSGSNYLVGNPYPSAIDAEQFILDNGDTIDGTGSTTGTLYFWEHWGGGSHILAEYQGGYGTYNLSGGTPSAVMGTNDPDVGTGGTPLKTPTRYIPVSQGFFVASEGTGGTINFNNGQRIFEKESSGNSIFMEANPNTTPSTLTFNQTKSNTKDSNSSNNKSQVNSEFSDTRMKIRIGFNSVNTIRRQLLVTADENATIGQDWGYDGKNNEDQIDDMYWLINTDSYVIQGIDEFNTNTVLPLGVKLKDAGTNSITIDELLNIPNDMEILLHDKEMDIYHDLRSDDYQFYSESGTFTERFAIVFHEPVEGAGALGIDDHKLNGIDVHYQNSNEHILLVNPMLKQVDKIELYNLLGQQVMELNEIPLESIAQFKAQKLSTGTYIIKMYSETKTTSKKVLVH